MSLYALYRRRQWLGMVPAMLVAAALGLALNSQPLKIQPRYDESALELALLQPEPQPLPEPPAPPVAEPAPVDEHEPVLPLIPPPPRPTAAPRPVATPRPVARSLAKPPTMPAVRPATRTAAAPPTPVAPTPSPAPITTPAPPPAPPKVDSAGLEGGYLQALRGDIERFKQYPSGRQAALERPSGNVVVWMLVDRAGNVLDSGIDIPASSMLLNRAASASLQRLKHVKPFPEQAFGGRAQQRFTATFNYSVQ